MKAPDNSNPVRIIVNGVEKDYEAGATVTDGNDIDILARNKFPPEAQTAEPPIVLPVIPEIPEELPPVPDTDGTYTLQLVVDDGEAVLTWEAVEEEET